MLVAPGVSRGVRIFAFSSSIRSDMLPIMANTYSQLYTHLIFAVKERAPLIPKDRREELHKYITGIITNNDCKLIAINSMPDHFHIFVSMHPKIAVSDLVRDIKANSSSFVKQKGWSPSFAW